MVLVRRLVSGIFEILKTAAWVLLSETICKRLENSLR